MGKPADAAAQLQGHAEKARTGGPALINLALAVRKLHRDAEANRLLDRAESLVSDPELLARAGTARGNWYLDQGNLKEPKPVICASGTCTKPVSLSQDPLLD